MDESDLASGLVLAASLLIFAYLSLGQNHAKLRGNIKGVTRNNGPPLFSILIFLRLATLIAVTTSGVALFLAIPGITWPSITPLALGLLLLLSFLDWGTRYSAINHPQGTLTIVSPLLKITGLAPTHAQARESVSSPTGNGHQDESNGKGIGSQDTQMVITEEEQAHLDERERSMIRSILRLDEYDVKTVMVPRVDLVAVDVDTSLAEVAHKMLESGHSRLPVYQETIDNIVGIIHSRDLLPLLTQKSPWPTLEQLLRPPFFVPESKPLDELLAEFQKRRVQMALVVDEHGGIEGLVSLEDLLEEIVGEIEDEFSTKVEPQITPTGDGDFIVDARITLTSLENLISISCDRPEVDTIGGLVYSKLGKMPQAGDEVVCDGLRIKVLSTLGRRLRKLQIGPERPPD